MSEPDLKFNHSIARTADCFIKAIPALLLALLLLLSPILLCGDAYRIPPFENISTQKLPDGSYEIRYDLYPHRLGFANAGDTLATVLLRVSEIGGGVWLNIPDWDCLSGDIGENVPIGRGKRIVWNAPGESWYRPEIDYGLRLTAVDPKTWYPYRSNTERAHSNIPPPAVTPWHLQNLPEPLPVTPTPDSTLVRVPGGSITWWGVNFSAESFYMDKHEVTQAEYEAAMGYNPAIQFGVGPNHPVYYVSWLDAVVYCNLRSLREGLDPCYSLAEYGADPRAWPLYWDYVWDAAQANIVCDFSTSGYRLPTQEEWLLAARGSDASYYEYLNTMLATCDSTGAPTVCTLPVGSFAPNDTGIYDLHGNVAEWTWTPFNCLDRELKGINAVRDGFYYVHSKKNQAVGARLGMGASWDLKPWKDFDPNAHSHHLWAGYAYDAVGFRVCRGSK